MSNAIAAAPMRPANQREKRRFIDTQVLKPGNKRRVEALLKPSKNHLHLID
jgi:hypothetical protein